MAFGLKHGAADGMPARITFYPSLFSKHQSTGFPSDNAVHASC